MKKYLSMVTPDDVETQVLDWGQFQWMNEPEVTNVDKMIVGIGKIKPGMGHTRHNHPDSEEFIYFMKGTALQTIERPDGKQEQELHPGDLISIPQGWYHSTMNVGEGDLEFLCCYLNAGTEKDVGSQAIKIIPPKNNWKDEK